MRPTKAFRVVYCNSGPDGGSLNFSYLTYAHSVEHAEMKFYDGDCDGWELVSVERPKHPDGKVSTQFDRES